MSAKPRLSFYTNIPTPYQLDFFEALADIFELRVIYYESIEANRQWKLNTNSGSYETVSLKNSFLAKPFLLINSTFHFSWSIFSQAIYDKSPYIIVGGAYHTPNLVIAAMISKLRSKKVFFFTERIPSSTNVFKRIFKQIALLPVKWFCHALIAVGNDVRESYLEYGVRKDAVVIPYNVKADLFSKTRLDPAFAQNLKARLGGNQRLVLLSSGALIPRKGMDILIQAYHSLTKEIQQKCALVIIGDGPEKEKLVALAQNSPYIFIEGFKEKHEIPYYFSIADIFVFASHYDGWGLVINEALAAGLPVISSGSVTAARDLIEPGTNGYVCANNDPEEFKNFITLLVTDDQRRKEIGGKNRELGQAISSENCAKKLFDFIVDDK